MQYDVIVIGGGAAGLSGALALARARRRVLVIDAGQPRNAPAEAVHNYLGREGTPPGELLAIGRQEIQGYGAEVLDDTVHTVRQKGEGFLVNEVHGARRLLVTTGVVDELPGIPGVAEGFGRYVLHCPYCHGWEVRDRAVGIIATSVLAGHAAQLWPQWSDDVVLFTNGREIPGVPAKVRIVPGAVAAVDASGVHLADGSFVARDALVVQTRPTVRAPFLAGLGLEVAELEMQGEAVATYVAADPMGRTGVPGVWAAGNVTDPMAQVIGAAAAGMKAGAALNMDLIGTV